MIFGPTPVAEAAGALLAHSERAGKLVFKKGRLLTQADTKALAAAGVTEVFAARLEAGEVGEDAAAARIAAALHGPGIRANAPFTGRVNLFAEATGVFSIDVGRLDRRHPARLCGGGSGPDGGHHQDHPVCGARASVAARGGDCHLPAIAFHAGQCVCGQASGVGAEHLAQR
jgi:hypothetical protein